MERTTAPSVARASAFLRQRSCRLVAGGWGTGEGPARELAILLEHALRAVMAHMEKVLQTQNRLVQKVLAGLLCFAEMGGNAGTGPERK